MKNSRRKKQVTSTIVVGVSSLICYFLKCYICNEDMHIIGALLTVTATVIVVTLIIALTQKEDD